VRSSTAKRYRTVFDKFVVFAGKRGIMAWNNVDAEVLNAYATHLEKEGYAHKTQVNELVVLKQAVKWLIQRGHLRGTKPIELKLRKAESQRAYCWRPQEVRAMVEQCRSESALNWLGDVIIALACTGLRISELASLRWADLDLADGRLTLTDETGRAAAMQASRRELKSGRSRTFPIHVDLAAVLKRKPHVDGFVFHGPRGGRLKPDTVRRTLVHAVLKPLAKDFPALDGRQGFRDGRLHSFRHFFASTCANNGVPERMVMEWLGHADSEMVRHYYHLHDEEARRRMDALDFLGGAGGRSAGEVVRNEEDAGPQIPEMPTGQSA
jgi:integrase